MMTKRPATMNVNHKLSSLQRANARKHIENSCPYTFFNQLTSPELLDVVESLLPEHRERSFPPTETLSMFLAQAMNADRSCQNTVNEAVLTKAIHGMASFSCNTGSYCKARKRLPISMVSNLATHVGGKISTQSKETWLWKGRSIKLVDGTTISLPDTPENQKDYAQTKGKIGCPLSRVVAIICLASGGILNASISSVIGKGAGEQSLLGSMLDTLVSDDILLGDAYYGTYFLFSELRKRQVDAVFEQHGARKRSLDFGKGKPIGKKDHLITYEKPKVKPDWLSQEEYDSAPKTLTVRELKVGNKILVTTLLSPKQAGKNELKGLYKHRWSVEVDLRNIKTTLGMETLSCKSPKMIEKEMWVYFLAYNLIRTIMAEAASLSDILPRELSFKHSLQLWRVWRQQSFSIKSEVKVNILMLLLVEVTVGWRPGRVEPRAIKRWKKAYPVLNASREELRNNIRKHGHPEKIK